MSDRILAELKEKRRITLVGSGLLGLFFALIFTWFGRGSALQSDIVMTLAIVIAGPLVILSLILTKLNRRWNSPAVHWLTTIILACALIILLQVLSLAGGKIVHAYDMKEAKKYCESLIPPLEDYNRKYHYYPGDLGFLEFESNRPFPRLLELGTFYKATEYYFRFYLTDPGAEHTWYEYSSIVKKWTHHDGR